MKYYLANEELVAELNLLDCRYKTKDNQYILSGADVAQLVLSKKTDTLKEINENEAQDIINTLYR